MNIENFKFIFQAVIFKKKVSPRDSEKKKIKK